MYVCMCVCEFYLDFGLGFTLLSTSTVSFFGV